MNAPQPHNIDRQADRRDDQRRGKNAAPKSDRAGKSFGQRERHVGAEHVERAMREINNARHAEDDRQARRNKKQRGCACKTSQELNEVKGHIRSALVRFSVPWLHPSRRRFAPPQDEVFPFHLSPPAGRGRIASAIRVRGTIRESESAVSAPPPPPPPPPPGGEETVYLPPSFSPPLLPPPPSACHPQPPRFLD